MLKNISTMDEKFRISAQPRNIPYISAFSFKAFIKQFRTKILHFI